MQYIYIYIYIFKIQNCSLAHIFQVGKTPYSIHKVNKNKLMCLTCNPLSIDALILQHILKI